jgi:hypothetical protein
MIREIRSNCVSAATASAIRDNRQCQTDVELLCTSAMPKWLEKEEYFNFLEEEASKCVHHSIIRTDGFFKPILSRSEERGRNLKNFKKQVRRRTQSNQIAMSSPKKDSAKKLALDRRSLSSGNLRGDIVEPEASLKSLKRKSSKKGKPGKVEDIYSSNTSEADATVANKKDTKKLEDSLESSLGADDHLRSSVGSIPKKHKKKFSAETIVYDMRTKRKSAETKLSEASDSSKSKKKLQEENSQLKAKLDLLLLARQALEGLLEISPFFRSLRCGALLSMCRCACDAYCCRASARSHEASGAAQRRQREKDAHTHRAAWLR